MISLSLWIYGKPEWELDLDEDIDPNLFRIHGEELKQRLNIIANMTEKLQASGWSGTGELYTIDFSKNLTFKEAEKELRKLGFDPSSFDLMELEDEEELEQF